MRKNIYIKKYFEDLVSLLCSLKVERYPGLIKALVQIRSDHAKKCVFLYIRSLLVDIINNNSWSTSLKGDWIGISGELIPSLLQG